jgi:hypothetical protein
VCQTSNQGLNAWRIWSVRGEFGGRPRCDLDSFGRRDMGSFGSGGGFVEGLCDGCLGRRGGGNRLGSDGTDPEA